jgi:hypothetical protein
MVTPLALDKMTIEEKLQTMEALWDDLCQHEEALPVHDWQKEILDERERMIERGDSKFSNGRKLRSASPKKPHET